MTLDPAGLEAAAKVLAFRDLAADPDWHGVYEEEWAAQPEEYREAWRESVREVLAPYLAAVVPVTPTTENPYAGRSWDEMPVSPDDMWAEAFAAGRAAATPDPLTFDSLIGEAVGRSAGSVHKIIGAQGGKSADEILDSPILRPGDTP